MRAGRWTTASWCKGFSLFLSLFFPSLTDLAAGRLLEGERLKTLAKHAECAKTETHIMPESSQRRIIAPDSLSPLTADLCGILTTRLGGLISCFDIFSGGSCH